MRTWNNHRGVVVDSSNGFDVVDCLTCGFKHIVPIPSPEDLEAIYRQEYYTKEKPLYLQRYREDWDWWDLVYSQRYDTFEGLLPALRRRILDVGSGPGFFLLHGKQRGWNTLGIEPSVQAAAHSRELGLDIVERFLTEEEAPRLGMFDVVHMSAVLEHIPNPGKMVKLACELLIPKGLVCIVVPNDYNPFQNALRTVCHYEPWWVAPPHHVNYFDFGSMARLLKRNGFEVLIQEATFPIDMFLLMGEKYVGNDTIGRKCQANRKSFETNLAKAGLGELLRSIYRDLAKKGVGREVVVFGRKTQR